MLGVVIATSIKGCGKGEPSKPKIEYVEKTVEIPVEKIVYIPGKKEYVRVPVKVYISKIDSITGDTIYEQTEVQADVTKKDRGFKYETDSISAYGNLSIEVDTTEGYLFPRLNDFTIKYTEKQTTIEKKRTFGLYVGGGIGFGQGEFKAVNLGLDLAIKQKTLVGLSIEQPLIENGTPTYWVNVKRSLFK